MKLSPALCLSAGLLLTSAAWSQTPPATPPSTPGSDSPSAASSPHQRNATSTQTPEAPAGNVNDPNAAASPHQKEAMHEGMKGGKVGPAEFVKKASQDGLTEVALGKIALQKTKDENIRSFANRMVQDHGKANEELMSIAQSKNLEAPAKLDPMHQKMVTELSAKSGAEFDAAYASHMAMDHSKAVALFQNGASLPDADLAAFAKKTLSTLQDHKTQADSLHAKMRTASAQ